MLTDYNKEMMVFNTISVVQAKQRWGDSIANLRGLQLQVFAKKGVMLLAH